MGFKPVLAKARVGNEGNGHVEGILHLFQDDTLNLFLLHGYLNDVCSSTLHGGIDGVTLCRFIIPIIMLYL